MEREKSWFEKIEDVRNGMLQDIVTILKEKGKKVLNDEDEETFAMQLCIDEVWGEEIMAYVCYCPEEEELFISDSIDDGVEMMRDITTIDLERLAEFIEENN